MYEVVAKQMKRELTVTRKRYVTDMERTLNHNVRLKAQVHPFGATWKCLRGKRFALEISVALLRVRITLKGIK
jgi:hypothetical protein